MKRLNLLLTFVKILDLATFSSSLRCIESIATCQIPVCCASGMYVRHFNCNGVTRTKCFSCMAYTQPMGLGDECRISGFPRLGQSLCGPGLVCLVRCQVNQDPQATFPCVEEKGTCQLTRTALRTQQQYPDDIVVANGVEENDLSVAPRCDQERRSCKCMKNGCSLRLMGINWCFLRGITDPQNPTKNCFSDVTWNPVEARFYSVEACLPTLARSADENNETKLVSDVNTIDEDLYVGEYNYGDETDSPKTRNDKSAEIQSEKQPKTEAEGGHLSIEKHKIEETIHNERSWRSNKEKENSQSNRKKKKNNNRVLEWKDLQFRAGDEEITKS